ncbi:hypothetical protein [Aquabacterium sp. J223]|uniref:hypothetical protein n=1 Tax=Aquabacterium sp. J223 TaxID=2898431 RepID=UPI0021ADF62F|nr:hypothetical protein [Aquabacterium sp. J223]UUX95581.1 hypothetical protein LRS07_20650 [Aquabacterium sp. J223]
MKLHHLALATLAAATFGAQAQSLPAPGTPNGSGSVTPPTATMPAERWGGAARPSDPAPTAATAPAGTTLPPQVQPPVTRESARTDVYRGLRNGSIPNGEGYSQRMGDSPNGFDPVN